MQNLRAYFKQAHEDVVEEFRQNTQLLILIQSHIAHSFPLAKANAVLPRSLSAPSTNSKLAKKKDGERAKPPTSREGYLICNHSVDSRQVLIVGNTFSTPKKTMFVFRTSKP